MAKKNVTDVKLTEVDESVLQQLRDLTAQMKDICVANKIPMFVSYMKANGKNETIYENEMVQEEDVNVKLGKNYITPMLLVINGFPVTNKVDNIVVEIEDGEVADGDIIVDEDF